MDNRSLTEMTNEVAMPPLSGLPRSPATLAQWQPMSPALLFGMALFTAPIWRTVRSR